MFRGRIRRFCSEAKGAGKRARTRARADYDYDYDNDNEVRARARQGQGRGMKESIEIMTGSTGETIDLGRRLGQLIDRPLVIALTGDLGAGKTALVKGIAEGLGVPPECPVTSPTFTLVNEYDGRLRLFHVDLYRLAGSGDVADIGLEDIIGGDGVTAIEWAERLDGRDFSPEVAIDIRTAGENERIFSLHFYGPGAANLVGAIIHFSYQ